MKTSPWLRLAVTAGAILFVLALTVTYRFLESRGVFTSVALGFAGTCRAVTGVAGPGDIAVDAAGKTAYVSAKDGLYAYAYDEPGARLVKLPGTPKDFHPVGIDLYRVPGGGLNLIAVDRRSDGFTVDVFTVDRQKLEMIGSIGSDMLIDPADVAAVDEDRFYVVNAHTSRTALGRWLDDVLLLPRANVLFFDGMKFFVAAEGLNSPRGVAVNAAHLYVAERYPRTLLAFDRNSFSGELKNDSAFPVASDLDRIALAPDGSLWLAGQPKAFAGKPAPSQVFRVDLKDGVPQAAALVYADNGEHISGASIAVKTDEHLLIGSESDNKFLDCTQP